MAKLQERNGSFRILFNFRGKQRALGVGKVSRDEAQAKADQVGYLLMRMEQGFVAPPLEVDIVSFLERRRHAVEAHRRGRIRRGQQDLDAG